MLRPALICLALAVLIEAPVFLIDSDRAKTGFTCAAVVLFGISLFLFAHAIMERLAPTKHVPFRPSAVGRAHDVESSDGPKPKPVQPRALKPQRPSRRRAA